MDFTSCKRAKNEESGKKHHWCSPNPILRLILYDIGRIRSAKEIEFQMEGSASGGGVQCLGKGGCLQVRV